METSNNIFSSFWSEKIWLPPNITWTDVKTGARPDIRYAEAWHMLIPVAVGVAMIFVRQIIEQYFFAPLGIFLGIKDVRPKPPQHNDVLERNYNRNRRLHLGMALSLSKQTDMTEREIELWWALRRAQDKPTILNKFCETSFKGLCYTWNFYYGFLTLWPKKYLWDFDECFRNYPHHSLDHAVWWLYIFVIGFYWSLLIAHFYEPRRLDFYQMLLHHSLTIVSVNLFFICNLHRSFHVFIVLHDVVEYLLHIIKAVKYAKYERLAQVLFIIFVILWTPTRLLVYPLMWYRFIFKAPVLFFSPYPIYHVLAVLLLLFQGLHIFWTYLIYKVLFEALKGKLEDLEDIRSSCDEMDEDD